MKITVINGTEKRGVTYRLKEQFLSQFKDIAEITEYYLPKDCPSFCLGCTSCFTKGESTCKDHSYISAIEASLLSADLIVMSSPAYVMHATGGMKALLDHFGYRWMPHRPAAEMFGKRAVIITQCLGAGAKSAAKDIKHSLSWWGISKIGTYSAALMSNIVWDDLPEKKRNKLIKGVNKLARKFIKINYSKPAHTKLVTKIKFAICRMIQNQIRKSGVPSLDVKYWQEHGWLNKARPWKR
ncbi:MAG: NAD(P)H-dependent oxidoreductase [Clostridiales bacterium]|nr:NAD(P)H-dependent oxidoreductase [Clostridiales bacterium]